jgi:hypothetical protein
LATECNEAEYRGIEEKSVQSHPAIRKHFKGFGDKYDAWIHLMATAVITPNFTENGWGVTRPPEDLIEEFRMALHNGLTAAREEAFDKAIEGDQLPLIVHTKELNRKALKVLKPMHDEWVGVPRTGMMAYGLRAYRNYSALWMHVDKADTHICLAFSMLTDWRMDFPGNTNTIILESGDMLFYEVRNAFTDDDTHS